MAGLEFPWGPKPFAEVVAGPLLRNNRQTTDTSSLEGHYVGVYFSAHWVSTERLFRCFLLFSVRGDVREKKDVVSKAEEENRVETDKTEEQEGVGKAIVCACLH